MCSHKWYVIDELSNHQWTNTGWVQDIRSLNGKWRAALPSSKGYRYHIEDFDTEEDAKYAVERNNVMWS